MMQCRSRSFPAHVVVRCDQVYGDALISRVQCLIVDTVIEITLAAQHFMDSLVASALPIICQESGAAGAALSSVMNRIEINMRFVSFVLKLEQIDFSDHPGGNSPTIAATASRKASSGSPRSRWVTRRVTEPCHTGTAVATSNGSMASCPSVYWRVRTELCVWPQYPRRQR